MNKKTDQKITLTLPAALYHNLRKQAYQQGVSLPAIIRKKIELQPSETSRLAKLSVKEIIQHTAPKYQEPESRLDFFS